jgi:hypothetical protein
MFTDRHHMAFWAVAGIGLTGAHQLGKKLKV